MAKIPVDPQTGEFLLRPGSPAFDGQGWDGENTDSSPGSIAINEMVRGSNIRLVGNDIVTRPGLLQSYDFGLGPGGVDNDIKWMLEAPVDNPRVRLWLSSRGCFGEGIGTGCTVHNYDPVQVPVVQSYSNFFTGSNFQGPLFRYGSKLLIGDRSALREVITFTGHNGVPSSSIIFSPPNTPLTLFPGYIIRCGKEFNGLLYLSLENTADIALSKIVIWDGVAPADDLTGIRPAFSMELWQDKLVAGFDATAGHIRVRDAGAYPGTWNTFALAGFRSASFGNVMQESKQYLYIAGGNDRVYRFDGAALTSVRTVAGADTGGSGVTGVTLHHGLLYYLWNTLSPDYFSRIGRHDPESTAANEWTDTYKDITTEQPQFLEGGALLSYREQLYAGGRQVWLVATKMNDVQGTLEIVNDTGAPGAGFQVDQLLRFP